MQAANWRDRDRFWNFLRRRKRPQMKRTVRAIAVPSPISDQRIELDLPLGGSVAEVIKAMGLPLLLKRVCS